MSLRTQLEKGFGNADTRITKLEKAVKKIRIVVAGIIVVLIISLLYAIANGLVNVQNLA